MASRAARGKVVGACLGGALEASILCILASLSEIRASDVFAVLSPSSKGIPLVFACSHVIDQALRVEMESRRVLLANQEISLRERELTLEKRESDSGAISATLKLAAAAAGADAELQEQRQGKSDKQRIATGEGTEGESTSLSSPVEKFWPNTSNQDAASEASSNDTTGGTSVIPQDIPAQGMSPREKGGEDAPGHLPLHSFRCVCVFCEHISVVSGHSG